MSGSAWNGDRFRSNVAAKLMGILTGGIDRPALSAAVAESAAAAESACSGREMACHAGCPYCCVLNVAALLPEALIIAEWMQEQFPPAELEEFKKRLRVHRTWTRWMDDEERIVKHAACPMLDAAGSCTIHPVRPLACRGVTSLDSVRCAEAMSPGITDEDRLVPVDLMRRAAFDEAFVALAEALKANGLDDRSIEFGTGVLAFLESSENREVLLRGGRLQDHLWR